MDNKLIVVLGMHRSGTSAITRGLKVLGAQLGDRMMPAVEGNNEKGFWEDVDLNELNIEMLKCIDSDWSHLATVESSDIDILHNQGYFLRAAVLIREKIGDKPIYAFKDPRVAKLLPFWKKIFEHCKIDVSYVLAIRNPLSVVKSLSKRDGLDVEHSYLLWLGHVLTSLHLSTSCKRVLIDYDRLIISSDHELARLASHLDLEIDSTELELYKSDYLDSKLRHTIYDLDDLLLDVACPSLVKEVYSSMLEAASDKISISELEFRVKRWSDEFERIQSTLVFIDKIIGQRLLANQLIDERNGQILNLNEKIGSQATEIINLNQAVLNGDGHIAAFTKLNAERDVQIASLNQTIAECDGKIASLNQTIAECDGKIANLNQTIAERDRLLDAIYNSTSWQLTRLLRTLGHQLKRIQLVTKLVAPAIKQGGGVKNTFKKAFQLYKRDGFNGLKSGFRFVAKSGQVIPAADSAEFDRNDYTEWIRRYDTITDETRASYKQTISSFVTKPLISVLMPTYNPKAEWLIAAIESVRNQIYPNWELCVADDASTSPDVLKILDDYVKKDSRIKVVFREQNGHISAASNSALALTNGQYIALLDNDDVLSEQALFWVAYTIALNPDAMLIYSDEDKIDLNGTRYNPYFKPDFNPDLFLSHNMICHLGVYRADLVKKLGGFREGYEGSQDYDLALRFIDQIKIHQIIHIPRVLYHWRAHSGSTALAGNEKNYASAAGKKALNDHFARNQIAATVELLNIGMYRARYEISQPFPLVSLIIPTRNGLELIKQCIESIITKTTYNNFEIIIIDNGSDDPKVLGYFNKLIEDIRVRVIRDEGPFNFSALNNMAVEQAKGEYICLINNDIEVITPEWLEEMLSIAIQPGVGVVGARLWYPNDTLQHGGGITGLGGVAGHAHKHLPRGQHGYFARAVLIQTLSVVTAACLMVKKSTYINLSGLESNLKVAFNDIDFCLRVREAGFRNVWTPYAELYHHESATRGYEDTPEKKLRFKDEVQYMHRRWGVKLINDPAYNPNLTLDHEDFSYAWPPRTQHVTTYLLSGQA